MMEQTAELKRAVEFHGHICPGLIIGYRAALALAKALEIQRDIDEELVAVVENDACGVDAIQVLLGCSIGKGNLIYRDRGKHAFTLFRRRDGKGVRVAYRGQVGASDAAGIALRKKVMAGEATDGEKAQFETVKQQRMQAMLAAADEELFDFSAPAFAIPEKARLFESYLCECCGEATMEPRLRLVNGKKFCMDCAEPYQRGW